MISLRLKLQKGQQAISKWIIAFRYLLPLQPNIKPLAQQRFNNFSQHITSINSSLIQFYTISNQANTHFWMPVTHFRFIFAMLKPAGNTWKFNITRRQAEGHFQGTMSLYQCWNSLGSFFRTETRIFRADIIPSY